MHKPIVISLFGFFLLACSLLPVPAAAAELFPEVKVEGVSGALLDNVTQLLRPPSGLMIDGEMNELWLNRYLRLAPAKVARALEPFGYYAVKVDVQVDRTGTPPTIRVVIEPGSPVRVTRLNLLVDGPMHPAFQKKIDRFPLQPGDVLQHLPYDQFKSELLGLAIDLGYLDAVYSHHLISVDRVEKQSEIDLILQPGLRFQFGDIRISGGEEYPERFLRRYLVAEEGQVFSYADLGKTQQKLLDSDRFSKVIPLPLRQEMNGAALPVELRLEAKAPKRLRPGIGYGTDTGARLFLRYQDVNLWHLGHELTTDFLVAERQQNLIGTYIFPGYRNVDTQWALRGGYKAEDLDSYDTRYLFAETEFLYGFATRQVGSVFLRYQTEESTISGDKIRSSLLMPGLRFRMSRIDDPVRPRRGYSLSIEGRGAWDELLSDVTLFQALGDINWIYPLPWRLYLRLRGSAALSWQKNDFDEIPASLRFFAGGDNSVRGYAYQSLGPTDAAGEVIGGRHLLVGSLELEKRFLDNWSAALFYDAGNAFTHLSDYDLAEAAGVGLRYFTPVGPARIDVARTLDAEKVSYRLHIGLGVRW